MQCIPIGKRIVHVNMMTSDPNADLYIDLHADLYGDFR